MNAISQRCRPKHQVLVLKCYPRTTKGAVDVKPNSSELSYLLYYATSRRTKVQKVGGFLEKKTASDVWRQRHGNLRVTLKILEALIEKNPKDLPLFAPSVLNILDLVLKSNDITMIESSLPTFQAFCRHHDAASLFADHTHLKQYESIVSHYAGLASTRSSPPSKNTPTKPLAMRWRNVGLEAIKSVASSDALSSISGRQYEVIVPMILENLWTDNEDFLDVLLLRAQLEEKVDSERLLKRRTSIATVRTADTAAGDTNPMALTGTAMDVDKLAEEDNGVLAMQCLKQIFVAPVRSQIRSATIALLTFIEERVAEDEKVVKPHPSGEDYGWAVKIFGLVSRWAPVQDRYTILVTTLDTMSTFPVSDGTLAQHVVLAALIGSLLRSDVNLIGLGVMDVLLGLIHHMKRLVQMPEDPSGGRGTQAAPQPLPFRPDPRSPTTIAAAEVAKIVADQRKDLLTRIQQCMGDLATHVYYADQISDMISAILLRLRPARPHSTANSSPQGEKADESATASAIDTSAGQSHSGDSLFSLTVAKMAALRAIKAILLVANPRTKLSGNLNLSRNRVPMQVWEGTHWLLRDPDGLVRKGYVDALLTWLDRETTSADLKARDEHAPAHRPHKANRELTAATVARRAASSASQRDKPIKAPKSFFLQLLHVAVYDNALLHVDYETDIVLLHVLLAKLVARLGINAARYGIPMIFQLQECILEAETPQMKVRLGSLVHGYFWALTEKFDCEASAVGRAIHNEIVRRRSKHFWVEGVHMPAPLLELVGTPGMSRPQPRMSEHEVEYEALLPFDDRLSLVDAIVTGYEGTMTSPPQSPSASPGRSFTYPMLGSTMSGGTVPTLAGGDKQKEVPPQFRENMLQDWSREAVLLAVQASTRSASLNGSKAGTSGTNRRLVVNGGTVGNGHAQSPFASQQNLRPHSQPAPAPGGLVAPGLQLRKSSVRSGVSNDLAARSSSSSKRVITSVDQLKMVLTGQAGTPDLIAGIGSRAGATPAEEDWSSESMVSYDMTPSELSFNPAAAAPGVQTQDFNPAVSRDGVGAKRSQSRDRKTISIASEGHGTGPLNSNPVAPSVEDDEDEPKQDGTTVPPVPPLPTPLREAHSVTPTGNITVAKRPSTGRRNLKSRGGESVVLSGVSALGRDGDGVEAGAGPMDLESLLKGIDSKGGEKSLRGVTVPPY